MSTSANKSRRQFVKTTAALATGFLGLPALMQPAMANDFMQEEQPFMIGPLEGYSPHIGALVSMLNYNRRTVINAVKSLTMAELDHLHDPKANTIGALVLHLGAVDKFYQINTFEGRQEFNEEEKKVWNAAMNLGDEGRRTIKGKDVKFYLDTINQVRQKTLDELKKRDDKWLLAMDPQWSQNGKRPLNTYWKWFHVCEHEANHRGQITWLKGRLPGAKETND
jgi:uncharacterized damage-inducible protein DinB